MPALLIGIALSTGCHAGPAPAAKWRLSLSTEPASPAILSETRFVLRVSGPDGKPINGANASVDLVMATMDMGSNEVELQPQGGGVYAGPGHFTMAGDWNCTVTVKLGGRSQTAVFHFKVS